MDNPGNEIVSTQEEIDVYKALLAEKRELQMDVETLSEVMRMANEQQEVQLALEIHSASLAKSKNKKDRYSKKNSSHVSHASYS